MASQIINFFSLLNKVLPSIVALLNILVVTKMYGIVIAQNEKIICLLTAKQEVVETTQALVENISTNTEVSIWSNIMAYAAPVGFVVVFVGLLYFYSISGSSGSSPDISPIINKQIEEKSTQIIETVGQKSGEIVSKIAEKANESAISNQSMNDSIQYLLSSMSKLSDKVEVNESSISTVISNQSSIRQSIDTLTGSQTEGFANYLNLAGQVNQIKVGVEAVINILTIFVVPR